MLIIVLYVKAAAPSGGIHVQGGLPPLDISDLDTKLDLTWRVFGVTQNPSGFGVFRPMSH